MLKVISTHVLLRHRLHPGLLDHLARAGAQGVEIFAARQHFDYTNRQEVRDLANWFASNPMEPFSMHAPLFPDRDMGRGGAPSVNLLHPEKSRRIDAMDEIKRALEAAEQIPLRYLNLHLGDAHESWNVRALEHSITALEHLRAFANPLGVKLVVENLQNEVTQPAHLKEILTIGHFKDIGFCFDTGHAHLEEGVAETFSAMQDLVRTSHIHDNHGEKDEHLWPGEGTIPWDETMQLLKAAPLSPAGVLEIHYALEEPIETIVEKAQRAFEKF
jgi:sugar phosphate isomerase/epimerase